MKDTHGHAHEIEVTLCGGKLIVFIAAVTKISVAGKVALIHKHVGLSMRAQVTQAQQHGRLCLPAHGSF